MNLLAGLLILICLAGSEYIGATAADDIFRRIAAVAITAAFVPAVAFFQTSALICKIRRENFSAGAVQLLCRRMTISHALVWLSASAAIIWALRWQDVVRGNWQLDRWPLVDDLLILAPAIVSMLASWAIFYELQVAATGELKKPGAQSQDRTTTSTTKSNACDLSNSEPGSLAPWFACFTAIHARLRPRLEFVSIRFRVYFLLLLIPIGIFVFFRDAAENVAVFSESVVEAIAVGGLLVLMLGFPFLLLSIWKNSSVEDAELRAALIDTCRQHELHVFDVRTWRTGNQIINAVVAGWFPGLRIIFLSDGLLSQFDRSEVLAVLRHEAGHIRLRHVPQRMFFLVLPPLVLLAEVIRLVSQNSLDQLNVLSPVAGLAMLVFLVYELLMVRWLSHQMEFEADLFAIHADQRPANGSYQRAICPHYLVEMRAALIRLAAFSGDEMDRPTLLHPSLRSRLQFLNRIESSPEVAGQFQEASHRQRRLVGAILVLVLLMVPIVRIWGAS